MRSGVRLLALISLAAPALGCAPLGAAPSEVAAAKPAQASIRPPHEGRLEVSEQERPEVHAEIPWPHVASLYGYGSVRLWGHPLEDNLHARLIVDVPARERRWEGCSELQVRIDGAEQTLPARYVGRPLRRGVYDAVGVEVPIEVLRTLAAAGEVQAALCGDGFALDASQRATLRRFVAAFDRLAEPGVLPYDAPIEIGPEVVLPGEVEEDLEPLPA